MVTASTFFSTGKMQQHQMQKGGGDPSVRKALSRKEEV